MLDLQQETESRRVFLKNGFRTVLCGGFVFVSVLLGKRKYSKPEQISSCPDNTPCKGCSKLQGCDKPKAIPLKQKQSHSIDRSSALKMRGNYGK